MSKALRVAAPDAARRCADFGVSAREDILTSVPADVGARLSIYSELVIRWQRTINLVAPSTIPDLWARHIGDSLQIQAAVPDADVWVDLGSGGGFPGLVTAILLAERPHAHVHLVESDKRKAAFLQTVSRETQLKTTVHATRVEFFLREPIGRVDAVSARALAPLQQLLDFAEPMLETGAIGVFPKGQNALAELTALGPTHRFDISSKPSRSDPAARIFFVKMRRTGSTADV